MKDLVGKVLDGKYTLTRLIGRGGMGSVYEASHTVIKRRVAVKLLNPEHAGDADISARFVREAQAASEIGHPGIIEIQDVGQSGDETYIVMELLEGTSLSAMLRSRVRLPPEHVVAIARQIAAALEAAHARGIVHRDLKTDNVFVIRDERLGERIKILDFGISKVMEREGTDLTQTGAVMGTPHYMAPEQVRGAKDVDARIDVWALGVMMYQMLTGTLPFPGERTPEVFVRILTEPMAPWEPDVPDRLMEIVEKALEKDRSARYASVAELRKALEPLEGRAPDRPADEIGLGLEETLATPSAQRKETSKPPAPLAYKRILWYAVTVPISWMSFAFTMRGGDLREALGVPPEAPIAGVIGVMVIVSLALTLASVLLERFWRGGVWNRWLTGPLFGLFPAAGLLLVLYHFLTLRGQLESHMLALRSYSSITEEHAARISDLIGRSYTSFLSAVSFDCGVVCELAVLVLLAFLFLRGRKGDRRSRLRWLVLPAGVVLIAAVEVAFSGAMGFMGPLRVILYLAWLVAAVALIRTEETRIGGQRPGWPLIASGVIGFAALSGSHVVMGYVMVSKFVGTRSLEEMSPATREWLYSTEINPAMVEGIIVLWVLILALFVLAGIVARRGLPLSGLWRVAPSLAGLLVTAAPTPILLVAMQQAGEEWSAYKFARMHPVTSSDHPYYIDAKPESLRHGADGLFASLTGKPRMEYTEKALVEALAGSADCDAIVSGSPARCVTAIEAKLYCESFGKRLPTPEEWDHALGPARIESLERDAIGEWTMRLVHGTATFEVKGADASDLIPRRLEPAAHSPHVGFRCAFSFE